MAALGESWQAVGKKKCVGLTVQEQKIVDYMVDEGAPTNAEIAKAFGIRASTVRRHLNNVFDKLGVFSKTELAIRALHTREGADGQIVRSQLAELEQQVQAGLQREEDLKRDLVLAQSRVMRMERLIDRYMKR